MGKFDPALGPRQNGAFRAPLKFLIHNELAVAFSPPGTYFPIQDTALKSPSLSIVICQYLEVPIRPPFRHCCGASHPPSRRMARCPGGQERQSLLRLPQSGVEQEHAPVQYFQSASADNSPASTGRRAIEHRPSSSKTRMRHMVIAGSPFFRMLHSPRRRCGALS